MAAPGVAEPSRMTEAEALLDLMNALAVCRELGVKVELRVFPSGHTPSAGASNSGPLSAAERARRYRANRHARHGQRDEIVTNVTENVTASVTGDIGGSSSGSGSQEELTSGKETRIQSNSLTGQDQETPKLALTVTENVTRHAARDVTQNVTVTFECWRELYSPRSALDAKRRRRIEARLREGLTAEDLCRALRNAKNDPFLMGQNDTGRLYTGIETLLRDRAQVERLIALDEPTRPRSAPVRNAGTDLIERAHRIAAAEREQATNGARPAQRLLSEFPLR
jgi:hypothetical protein